MIKHFTSDIIEAALKIDEHQYLVGDLVRPQAFPFFLDMGLNIGMGNHSNYEWEKPHYHSDSTEFQYVICGEAKYIDLDENKEYLVRENDFFIIPAKTSYILKANSGTRIIFVKHPACNDKICINITDKMKYWVEDWENRWNEDK